MIFKRLHIQNFFSIDEANISLASPGAFLVTGEVQDGSVAFSSNGAGKTSLFNALVWCLFGRTIRDLPSDEDVIRTGADVTRVTVELETVDGTTIIDRSRKRGKASILKVTDGDGKDRIVAGTVVELSKRLEEQILRCTFDVFCNTVYFPQGSFTFFTQASDVDKKKIFDRLLGTDSFGVYETRAKERKKECELELEKLTRQRAQVETACDIHLRSLLELDSERADLVARYDAKIADAKKTKPKVNLKKLENCVTTARAVALEAETEYEEILKQAEAHREFRRRDNALRDKVAPYRQAYGRAYAQIESARKLVKDGKCPTCEQPLDKSGGEKTLDKAKAEFAAADEALKKAEQAVKDNAANAPEYVGEFKEEEAKTKYDTAVALLEVAEEELSEAKSQASNTAADVAALETAKAEGLESIKKRRTSLQEKAQLCNNQIAEYSSKIGQYEADLKTANFWIIGFGPRGIRSLIYENLMPYVNERANHYSSILTDGAIDIEVTAQTKLKSGEAREKISVTAINQSGASVYEANSGGERKRIDLCILLALQDLMVSRTESGIGLSIYDELLDELDEEGIERVVELLKDRGRSQPVYLISHNTTLKGYFEDVITVEKTHGISRVKQT